MIWKHKGVFHYLPNIETVEALNYNVSNIKLIDDDVLSNFQRGKDGPDLKLAAYNPDELVRLIYQRAIFMSPLDYWVDSYPLKGYFNPSFARWHDEILMVHRQHIGQPGMLPDPTCIAFVWLTNNTFLPNITSNHRNISVNTIITEFDDGSNHFQEDPRVLVLKNGSLLLTYATYHNKIHSFLYAIIDFNSQTGLAEIGGSYHFTHHENDLNQKNWMPLESAGRLLFFQSINPMHIVEIDYVNVAEHKTSVKTVHKSELVTLPFNEDFYGPVRGGTPAILIRGLYVSLFHTRKVVHKGFKIHTYVDII
jgi:hypothetical protein